MTNTPMEPVVDQVVADPKKPNKAFAAGAVTLIGTFWAALAGREDLGDLGFWEWVAVLMPPFLAFAATYTVPNPKVLKRSTR